jgi:nucleoredoxin
VSDVDIIGFYFGTSWCSPCKKFTPRLRDFYNMLKTRENLNSTMEIVVIPMEPLGYDLDEFLSEMPWLVAEHQNSLDAYLLMVKSFGIRGIPHLGFVEAGSLSILRKDARLNVIDDPQGVEFPWKSGMDCDSEAVEVDEEALGGDFYAGDEYYGQHAQQT